MHTTGGAYKIDSVGNFNLDVTYDENFKTISKSEGVTSKISFIK
jgi:hypothetical protein